MDDQEFKIEILAKKLRSKVSTDLKGYLAQFTYTGGGSGDIFNHS